MLGDAILGEHVGLAIYPVVHSPCTPPAPAAAALAMDVGMPPFVSVSTYGAVVPECL